MPEKRVGFVYDDVYLRHRMPEGHPERPERLVAITEALRRSGLYDNLILLKPRKALKEELSTVHTIRHIERMEGLVGYADPDTYVSEGTYEAAIYAAGAVLSALEEIKSGKIDRAFCAVRPPGHHAESGRTSGFCLFNNIAVGARHAQRLGYKRVFIVDFDVHHGNGTEHMFEEDPDVFYFSTHQYPHFPGSGAQGDTGKGAGKGSTMNIPMPPGAGDEQYISIYRDLLPGVIGAFSPDILMVSAGYDLHARDPLAYINVSDDGLEVMLESIIGATDAPAVFVLEGGYNLEVLGRGVTSTVRALFSK